MYVHSVSILKIGVLGGCSATHISGPVPLRIATLTLLMHICVGYWKVLDIAFW